MDFGILNAGQQPIPFHAYAAFVAVGLGAVQLASAKGTRTHKMLGYIWVSLMLLVSVSSFWIHTIKVIGNFSPIHLLSLLTIWSVVEAIRTVRRGNVARHALMMKLLYVLALLLTGAFTLLPGRMMHQVIFGG